MSVLFKTMSKIAPGYAARKIHNYISNPRVRKLRAFETNVLERAECEQITFRQFEIQKYTWGDTKNPIALLVHGWEGHAGNFGNLVSLLCDKGYQVVAYDGPAHGKSSKHSTNMFEYADFMTQKIAQHKPSLIISHSFGTITTLLGLVRNPKFHLQQWFIVTTPFSFHEYVLRLKKQLGLSARTFDKLKFLLERGSKSSIEDLNVAISAKELNGNCQITIIHSPQDKVIPVEDARKVHNCLPTSELIEPANLGHYKILWSDQLKNILDKRTHLQERESY